MALDRKIHGLRKDSPDERDLRYRADYLKMSRVGQLLRAFVLPESVDLRSEPNAPVWNQGSIGSCADQALAACMAHVAADQGNGAQVYSRLFMYGNARGWVKEDLGSSLRDAIKGVDRHGAPLEVLWPYDVARWQESPPPAVWDAALHRHEIEYYRLVTAESMKMGLARERKPFLFGVAIYDSFACAGPDYLIPMPRQGDRMEGGHAMTCMGYDDRRKAWLVRNSWGDDWGDAGHCWIPYAYLADPDLFYDAWAIRKVTA
jgi:C1A family cysteine protease